ncbi:MAG: ParA family protein [Myxococcota bacterium]
MGYAIAVANMKGGVGKTTTTVSLADTFAAQDKKVLVVDLDAQANASVSVIGIAGYAEVLKRGHTIEHYFQTNVDASLRRESPIPASTYFSEGLAHVTHQGEKLDITLLAASPEMRYLERDIIIDLNNRQLGLRAVETKLAQILKRDLVLMRRDFDYVLFDCAPGISPFSEAAIRLVDLVISPTIPDFISVQGLPQFCNYLAGQRKRQHSGRRRSMPHVLATRVRSNTQQHREYLRKMDEAAAVDDRVYGMFKTHIPDSIKVSQAIQVVDDSFPTYQQRWSAMLDQLDALTNEIEEVLDGDHAV